MKKSDKVVKEDKVTGETPVVVEPTIEGQEPVGKVVDVNDIAPEAPEVPVDIPEAYIPDANEVERLSTVAEVLGKAALDPALASNGDTDPVGPDEPTTDSDSVTITTNAIDKEAINEIVKSDLPLLDRLDKIAKLLPQSGGKTIKSLLYLFQNRVDHAEASVVNGEQRSFVRAFKKVLALPQSEFNESFRYIKYAYSKLMDKEVLKQEKLPIINNLSPLDPLNNQMLHIANKDDAELVSFVYLFTLLSVKQDYPNDNIKVSKVSISGAITDDDVTKINTYYNTL